MEGTEKRSAAADVCVRGDEIMPRAKKESENFSCKIASEIYKKLEEYCKVSGLSKTAVVELAVERYVTENLDKMKEITKNK